MAGFNEKDAPSRFRYLRPGLYGFTFALIFCLAAAELGIVSDLLHEGGNSYALYPSMEFKHDLGILLFSCIITFLYVFTHPWTNHFLATVCTFILAVFWGTGAGVIFHVSPFEDFTCRRPISTFTPPWQAYFDKCHRVVAMQGIAWALWGIFVFMLIGLLIELFQCSRRPNVKPFYAIA